MEAGGFSFFTDSDARLAEAEQRKIEYLEARIDYSRPESILHVYDKAIDEQLFKTPVGFMYLKKLQDFLLKQPQIDPERVKAIPLHDTFEAARKQRRQENEAAVIERVAKRKEAAAVRFQISVILNILLILAICAMFIIMLNSDQPNILNYERAIVDRYSYWEQQLTDREQAIREKERELDLDSLQ